MKKLVRVIALPVTVIFILAATLDLNNTFNYESQTIQPYIAKDNTGANPITDLGATLGRVLFYDKNMSLNNSTACASCHHQEFAFGDTALVSDGFDGGVTARHSMRLINARFAEEVHFFWDERADSLEMQTTMPIQDHVEMGFSGTNGQPDFDSLVNRLYTLDYYNPLFEAAFGDTMISEDRIQKALAQFVRSIQSFDSRFDIGRVQVANDGQDFPNYTTSENNGKQLFLAPPPLGGAGCAGCHRPPEFDIDPNVMNNGIIGVIGSTTDTDLTNTKAPTIRDIINPSGDLNGPLMHNGSITTLGALIAHYNVVPQNPNNTNLDPRLQGPGGNLQLTPTEQQDLINFLRTLTGSDVYTNKKWSDPFGVNGEIDIVPLLNASLYKNESVSLKIFPNPTISDITISSDNNIQSASVYNLGGKLVYQSSELYYNEIQINTANWESGVYLVYVKTTKGQILKRKIVKR
jgi:cytochrome c peroxidase